LHKLSFVIALSIEIGIGLYETVVIVPLWAGSAPDSVIAFYQPNATNLQLALTAWLLALQALSIPSKNVLD
jgi:hypothetical protein